MTKYFDESAIRDALRTFPKWKCVSFGALLLERSLPNYLMFQVEAGVLGGAALRAALARVWGWLETEDESWIPEISPELCQSFAPDTELHAESHTSSALDAVGIASNNIAFLLNNDVELLVECATLLHDSMYLYFGNREDTPQHLEAFDRNVRRNPVVEGEVNSQLEDIHFLKDLPNDRSENWRLVLSRSIERQYGAPTLIHD